MLTGVSWEIHWYSLKKHNNKMQLRLVLAFSSNANVGFALSLNLHSTTQSLYKPNFN